MITLADGDTLDLRIAPVAKQIGDARLRMLAYNGTIPGPTLHVRQGSTVEVRVFNEGDLETTVHWHGLRLDNRYDGTTETQSPIPLGGSFTYHLSFPDPGVYWYHPHIREDYTQELGLSGAIVVAPSTPDYWPPVHRELVLTLDDLLVEHGGLPDFSRAGPAFAVMGRFGNVLLANGDPALTLEARRGEAVRFYLTNSANARVFNVALRGARMKLVGGDSGRSEREAMVDSVLVSPSERVIVDVRFDSAGQELLEHRTPQGNRTLATINVASGPEAPADLGQPFDQLRHDPELTAVRAGLEPHLRRDPDRTLVLVSELRLPEPEVTPGAAVVYYCPMHPEVVRGTPGRCPSCGMKLLLREATGDHATPGHGMQHGDAHGEGHGHGHHAEHAHFPSGIEWEDDMLEVNRRTTWANTRWKLVDQATGAEGPGIAWRFRVGDRVKIRLVNTMDSDHPMHHPFHIHGAGRFLILARDGQEEANLVWKDTVLVPAGQTVDLLLDVTNPGRWMAHCHIAEHHESGMMITFDVAP